MSSNPGVPRRTSPKTTYDTTRSGVQALLKKSTTLDVNVDNFEKMVTDMLSSNGNPASSLLESQHKTGNKQLLLF